MSCMEGCGGEAPSVRWVEVTGRDEGRIRGWQRRSQHAGVVGRAGLGRWELRWALQPPARGERTSRAPPARPGAGIHGTAPQAPGAPAAPTPVMRGEAPAVKLKPDVQRRELFNISLLCACSWKAPAAALAPESLLSCSPSVP